MPYVNGRRAAVPAQVATQMQHAPFVAPTGGWVSAVNFAAAVPGTARICENWFPTTTGLRLRAGSQIYATTGTTSLESAMAYIGGTVREMFAANDGDIFDVTTPADPDVIPTPVVTGQTSNYYSYANFSTVGGNFLTAVNGTDDLLLYDGTDWTPINGSSTPAITGIDTALLSHVNVYRNRQWFVEKDTLNVHYLPVDSIGGAIGTLTVAGVFKRGGSVLFTATWSMDAGDGLDDKFVVVSTEGEVAVYQGSNPSDIADWSLVGRYDASPPLGKNAYTQVGGDLLILTEIGIIPMTAIQAKDPSALALAAVSRNIQPDWIQDARDRRALPWEVVKWTSRNIAFISCPTSNPNERWCYAVNLETNAWAKYTGWDTRCLVLHEDQVYFGTSDGKLMQAEVTGNDVGQPIYHTYVGHAEHLGSVGRYKTVMQARAQFRVTYPIAPQLSVSTNYEIQLPAPPNVGPEPEGAGVWDGAIWDVSTWDSGAEFTTQRVGWVSIGRSGDSHALQVQVTSGQTPTPMAELILVEVTYNPGGFVV